MSMSQRVDIIRRWYRQHEVDRRKEKSVGLAAWVFMWKIVIDSQKRMRGARYRSCVAEILWSNPYFLHRRNLVSGYQ